MKKQLFVLGMVSAFALCGCHGTKKVEFKAFCDEVNKLEEVKVASVKISGKYDDTKVSLTYEWPQSAGNLLDSALDSLTGKYNEAEQAGIYLATGYKTPAAFTLAEEDGAEYYIGMGFKVKEKEGSIEWAKNGLLASYKAKSDNHSCNFTFSWKKA